MSIQWRKIVHGIGLCLSVLACIMSLGQKLQAQAFTHPGLLHKQADFDRMKTQVAAGAHPWIDSWNILIANSHASLTYTARPVAIVYRGSDGVHSENYSLLFNDIAAAYADALRWKISGNTAYADKAVQIMNAWSSTLTGIGGSTDADLAAGIYGYEFANIGEIMRTYSGFSAANLTAFQNMMVNVFYPINHDFLIRHNGTCNSHYFANWDLCNMASILAIGVLCDDRTKYNEALTYFTNGAGNGNIDITVYQVHPGLLGQLQESGRDQGHSGLDISLLGALCQMAWNQGNDLFGYENNRVLAGAEYFAKYNLGNSVPYASFSTCEGSVENAVSSASLGDIRPTWALFYNHYVNLMGLEAPYTKQYMALVGTEGGGGNYGTTSGGFDQLGYTTLTCTLPPITTLTVPTGLTAWVTGPIVQLAWWGAATAISYEVKRATVSGGPYTTIASNVDNTNYTDTNVAQGVTYYYVVDAIGSSSTSANSAPVATTSNTQIAGTIIGTPGSYYTWPTGDGNTIANAFDRCLKDQNYVDGPDARGDWLGLDIGAGYTCIPTQVAYCPRAGNASRMVGGQFQGSNVADFSSGVTTLYTITTAPANGVFTTATFSNTLPFRYVRFVAPSGPLNIGEVQFFGNMVANGTYKIINRNSGYALDAYNQLTANGTQIQQYQYWAGAGQQWTVTSLGNGQYKIIGVQSGKALDVFSNSTADGAKVELWTYSGGNNQRFSFVPTSGGYYRITPVHSGKCLDVVGMSTANSALVDQWTWLGNNGQQWSLSAP